jgi:hypothetical protein
LKQSSFLKPLRDIEQHRCPNRARGTFDTCMNWALAEQLYAKMRTIKSVSSVY